MDEPQVEAMLNFSHPNIVKVHRIIDEPDNNHIYFVMDYLTGRHGRSLDFQLQTTTNGIEEIKAL